MVLAPTTGKMVSAPEYGGTFMWGDALGAPHRDPHIHGWGHGPSHSLERSWASGTGEQTGPRSALPTRTLGLGFLTIVIGLAIALPVGIFLAIWQGTHRLRRTLGRHHRPGNAQLLDRSHWSCSIRPSGGAGRRHYSGFRLPKTHWEISGCSSFPV